MVLYNDHILLQLICKYYFDYLYKEGFRYHEPSMMLRVVNAKPKLQKNGVIDNKRKNTPK